MVGFIAGATNDHLPHLQSRRSLEVARSNMGDSFQNAAVPDQGEKGKLRPTAAIAIYINSCEYGENKLQHKSIFLRVT